MQISEPYGLAYEHDRALEMVRTASGKEEAPDRLSAKQIRLPPLHFKVREVFPERSRAQETLDAVFDVTWNGRHYPFGAIYKRLATPKIFREALIAIAIAAPREKLNPLLVMQYLSEERLNDLEQRSISGLDFCGNGIIVVPGKLLVFRSGAPNRFSTSVPIKNIYRRSSSLVARVFLERPVYESVNEIHEEILGRGGSVSLATVSRVLKALSDDLIIDREKRGIRLLQAEKLLTNLVINFEPPTVTHTFMGQIALPQTELMPTLHDAAGRQKVRIAISGVGSAGHYAVMAKDELLSVYCTDYARLISGLPAISDTYFPNLKVQETTDETAYFDIRNQDGYPWASPLQTYLELMTGEKRDRETAEQVRAMILRELKGIQEDES